MSPSNIEAVPHGKAGFLNVIDFFYITAQAKF